jgi:hypothetical protein
MLLIYQSFVVDQPSWCLNITLEPLFWWEQVVDNDGLVRDAAVPGTVRGAIQKG